jgi:hypothetical protein
VPFTLSLSLFLCRHPSLPLSLFYSLSLSLSFISLSLSISLSLLMFLAAAPHGNIKRNSLETKNNDPIPYHKRKRRGPGLRPRIVINTIYLAFLKVETLLVCEPN